MTHEYTEPAIMDKKLPEKLYKINLLEMVKEAPLDETVGIRHTKVTEGGKRWNYHVASIQRRVNPHVHMEPGRKNLEMYYTLKGRGIMHTGHVTEKDGEYTADWNNKIELRHCCIIT